MRFSIITPSFNQLELLKRCAASVADQVGPRLEVEHLLQDGSPDSVIADWARSQKSIRLVSEPDEGMYDAIEKGFARSRGDLVSWLNCDEQYLPDALPKVADWFRRNPQCDVLFGDVVVVDQEGRPLGYRQAVRPLAGHVRSCFLPTYSAATFVRRRVIDAGHHLDTRFRAIADAVWITGMLEAGVRTGVLNEPLAIFTQTGENLGQSESSLREAAVWRRSDERGASLRRISWTALHRVRKALAGAYRRRDLAIRLFLDDSSGRVERCARVGEDWAGRRP